ncbi:protein of unknown function DUF450 [Thalassoporum mexicanum PCC 7367]|uniref:hypothetical protein n=1 Tax=Thalassoporum mexicanum TaxID=3457544 RepID=UPI00029FEB60|nr:hypothetical protein [Pseudanabaena sp. PCC 7367]AFY71819.1 protein of unknown function DUF450 [Pseudanabaena sp. PCC 7367]
MVKPIAAEKITLYDLQEQFNLNLVEDPAFFSEWQQDLPILSNDEKERLQRVQAVMANLEQRSVLESTVKLATLAPLLDLAGLYLQPFVVWEEEAFRTKTSDANAAANARFDVLGFNHKIWVLAIETNHAEFSIEMGISQLLAYWLKVARSFPTLYSLVTNGKDFVFLKLVFRNVPCYARSKQFVLGQDRDLEEVLQIMKHLAELVAQSENQN